jgi:hypothetical protein
MRMRMRVDPNAAILRGKIRCKRRGRRRRRSNNRNNNNNNSSSSSSSSIEEGRSNDDDAATKHTEYMQHHGEVVEELIAGLAAKLIGHAGEMQEGGALDGQRQKATTAGREMERHGYHERIQHKNRK